MADFTNILAQQGGNFVLYAIIGIIALVVLSGAGAAAVFWYKKKKWNLNVNYKLPRSDGKIVLSEYKKNGAYWNAEEGCIMLKRKGRKAIGTRPIDPKEWLQGTNEVTVIQVGPEDFIIAAERSYTTLTDSVTGKEIAIMNVSADVGKRKVWKNYFERTAKRAFTLRGWAEKNAEVIRLVIVLFAIFIGFAIIWSRLPKICAA
jgi:NOL1/NOP2/fmu family ribosome biogenesis protein